LELTANCLRTKDPKKMVNEEWNGIVFGIMACPFVPVFDGKQQNGSH